MPIAYVQHNDVADTGATVSCTLSVAVTGHDVTAGNLLVAVVAIYNGTPATDDVSDTRGNTWTRNCYKADSSNSVAAIYSCIAKDSGAMTVTFDGPGGDDYLALAVMEFSGVANNTPDNTAAGGTASSQDCHHGNVTLSADGIVIGARQNCDTDVTVTTDANWTASPYNNNAGSSVPGLTASYRIAGSGTYNDGWTLNNTRLWSATAASYLAAAGGGTETLTAAQGSAAITGQAARLQWNQTRKVEQAAVAINGQVARLQWNQSRKVEQAAIAITGQAARFQRTLSKKVEQAAVAINDQVARLQWNQQVKAEQGAVALTMQEGRLQWNQQIKAEQGTVAINGQDATLTEIAAPGADTIVAEQGAIAISGQEARLQWSQTTKVEQASVAITGQTARLQRNLSRKVEQAAVAISMQEARLQWNQGTKAEQAAVAITGQTANLQWTRSRKVEQAAVNVALQDANLQWHQTLKAEQAAVAIAGQDAALTYTTIEQLIAEQWSVTINGQDAALSIAGRAVSTPAERYITVAAEDRVMVIEPETAYSVGAQLITNGKFATDISDWTNYGIWPYDTFEWSAGALHAANTVGTRGYTYSKLFTVTAGKTYLVVFDLTLVSGTAPSFWISKAVLGGTISGAFALAVDGRNIHFFTVTETSAGASLTFFNLMTETEFLLDNVSVVEYDADILAAAEADAGYRLIKVAGENRVVAV